MAFELTIKNGYTGETILINAMPSDTAAAILERAAALWRLPPVRHVILHGGVMVKHSVNMKEAKIVRGAVLEIIPDPFFL